MKQKTLDQYEVVEYEFSLNLRVYLQYFNLLERNVGYCISFLVNERDPSASYPFLDRLTTQAMMDVLKELIYYKNSDENKEMVSDFNEWFKLASETRAARNRYVHGYWDVLPLDKETPIRFHPTVWTSGIGKAVKEKDSQQKMSLDEFKSIVQEMKNVFEEFNKLRKKYQI